MATLSDIVGKTAIITQPYGQTAWSTGAGAGLYDYCTYFCLPPGTHPGIDIAGAYGDPLYTPVAGTVINAGGTGVFRDDRSGNRAHTGELKIATATGVHVILGHCSAILVNKGDRVTAGQHVANIGYENGNHVHIEVRIPGPQCRAGMRIIDPAAWLAGLDTGTAPGPSPQPGPGPQPSPQPGPIAGAAPGDILGQIAYAERGGGVKSFIVRCIIVGIGFILIRRATKNYGGIN